VLVEEGHEEVEPRPIRRPCCGHILSVVELRLVEGKQVFELAFLATSVAWKFLQPGSRAELTFHPGLAVGKPLDHNVLQARKSGSGDLS